MEKAASNHRRLMLAGAASAVVVGAATVFRSGSSAISYPHGSPLEVEISDLTEGKLRTVEWQGRPVWILRRSAQSVSALATHDPMLLDPESLRILAFGLALILVMIYRPAGLWPSPTRRREFAKADAS